MGDGIDLTVVDDGVPFGGGSGDTIVSEMTFTLACALWK